MRLALNNVAFTYPGATRPAVSGVTAVIESGRWIALLGANGSGKSTLGRLMAGLLTPTEGTVSMDGQPFKIGWNGVGVIFQNPDEQLFNPTVEREIAWGLENLALPPDTMEIRVREILERFDLTELAAREPFTLSDGQKQLVALASMEAMNPVILILDEPAAFLDPWWKSRLQMAVREYHRERSAVWISTRAEEAVSADEVWLLDDGRIVERGLPTEVLTNKNKMETLGIVPLGGR